MKKLNAIGAAVGTLVLGMGMAIAQAPQPGQAQGTAPTAAAKASGPAAAAKKGPARAAKAKPSESAQAVEVVAAAEAMARYGDRTKDPLALIAAARVIKDVGSRESNAVRTGGSDTKNKPDEMTVEAILARAKALAGGRADIVALADDVAKSGTRGGSYGPGIKRNTVVSTNGTDSYRIQFNGGEQAVVYAKGDGDSDLDMFVYNQNGQLVCRDEDPDDEMLCRWTPSYTGTYTVRIRNLGVANMYTIRHN